MNEQSPKPTEVRWGMTIDINRCVGCQTCTIACKHANDTDPGVQWRGVLDVETGKFPNVERLFLVTGCQHCAEPSCVPVCPTGATKQRADGLVTMDYDICIGCAACAVACPYQARTIVHDKVPYFDEMTIQDDAVRHEDRYGVAQKCTFCISRVDDGLDAGLTPGIDHEATPACASSCITQAIQFGDFNDPDSNVSRLTADKKYFQMHEQLGNDPQIKYLYETPAIPGRDPTDEDMGDLALLEPENPLSGVPQTFWDMRAAMNFILGGFGSGLVIMAYVLHLFGGLEETALLKLNLSAAGIIVVGLFFVWLKIGRKLRAALAILRPQTSWMSREIYAVAVLFGLGFIDYFAPNPALHALTALAALAFLYCQARILHASKGIPTWRVPQMPVMLVVSGLYEGAGLSALLLAVYPNLGIAGDFLPAAALVLAALGVFLWRRYVLTAKEQGIGPASRAILFQATLPVLIIAHVLPAILFVTLLIWPASPPLILGMAGISVLAGGFIWKAIVITRACHQQGFALAKFPQRGSGTYAAPLKG